MIKDYMYDLDTNELSKDQSIMVSDFIEHIFYDELEFHDYHKRFADAVFRFGVISNKKPIGYSYFGIKDDSLRAHYSAPFSLIYLKPKFKTSDACLFLLGLKKFATKEGFKRISFTLPPEIYGAELVNVLSSALFSEGFCVKSIELNNYIDFEKYSGIENYLKTSPRKVRKNYNNALKNKLEFEEVDIKDFVRAYDVIKINREQMGYPLKISKQQMKDIINMNSAVVRGFTVNKEKKPVAAALIFDVTEKVSQVVYWGDILEYRNERAMDLLTAEIFKIYNELGKDYLDIGPSSEDGIINNGLAEFKRSIGCSTNIKTTFEYTVE